MSLMKFFGEYMNKLINKILRLSFGRLLVIGILTVCIFLSFFATYTGFYDLINQSGELIFWQIVVALLFSFIVQFSVLYFSKTWWATYNKNYLFPLGFAVLISVIFAFGFYFDDLGFDKVFAGDMYTKERSNMLREVNFNQALINDLIKNTDEIVVHSQRMIENESRGLPTCDVELRGFGPRARYRQKDVDTFEYYKSRFGRTKSEFDRVLGDITADSLRAYSVSNAEALNRYAQELNGIIDAFDKNKESLLKNFLKGRVKHNIPGFTETFDNGIFREEIRCPDHNIERYYHYLSGMTSFNKIPPIDISNPDRKGVQVMQAFDMLANYIRGDFSSSSGHAALLFGLFVDILIFVFTYSRPNTLPPGGFRSWAQYFPFNEYQQLLKFIKVGKGRKGHLYIPINKDYLTASMMPLMSDGLVTYKGTIPWWLALFTVPDHIRKQGNRSCFKHYQINIHCLARWVLDHKLEQRRVANSDSTDKQERSLHNNSLDKGNADLVSNAETTPKLSLNGNSSKGVENGI